MLLNSFGIVQSRALEICTKASLLRTYALLCTCAVPIKNIPATLASTQLTELLGHEKHSAHIKELVKLGLVSIGTSTRAKGEMRTYTEYFITNLKSEGEFADFGRYFLVTREAVLDLDCYELQTYMTLLSFANHATHQAFPSRETIAQKLGIKDLDTVSDRTKALERKGWISSERRINTSNIYTVHYTNQLPQPTKPTKTKKGQGNYRMLTKTEDGDIHVVKTDIPLNGLSNREMEKLIGANMISESLETTEKLVKHFGLQKLDRGRYVDQDGVVVL